MKQAVSVQVFGMKNSSETRAAERFFKERGVAIHFVDLKLKPMSPGEIKRFVEKFGMAGIVDSESKVYVEAGLKYMKLSDASMLAKIEADPRLLRMPLVRGGKILSVGKDEDKWKAMLAG